MEIQHCVTQTSGLSFARCTKNSLPYTFKILEGGEFISQNAYGRIQLRSFSLLVLLLKKGWKSWIPLIFQEANIKYHSQVCYLYKEVNQRDIHFVVTKDLEVHTMVRCLYLMSMSSLYIWSLYYLYFQNVHQEYSAIHASIGPVMPVDFKSNSILLSIPSGTVDLEDGWKLHPLPHSEVSKLLCALLVKILWLTMLALHQITKEKVDSFEAGWEIPSCQLTAKWTKQGKQPSQLKQKVTLKGAKEPNNYFYIKLDSTPPDTTVGKSLGSMCSCFQLLHFVIVPYYKLLIHVLYAVSSSTHFTLAKVWVESGSRLPCD